MDLARVSLARLWMLLAVAFSPALAWAQTGAPGRSGFSWFTAVAIVAALIVVFGLVRDARRAPRAPPR